MAVEKKPLRLKDYLDLDAWGESFDASPRLAAATATASHLLEDELGGVRRLVRTRSRGALSRLSSALKLKLTFPFSLPFPSVESCCQGSLSRSVSKRIKEAGFWKKPARADGCGGKPIDRVADDGVEDGGSFDFPSPVISSCRSSSSETGCTSGSDFLLSSRGGSSECLGFFAVSAAAADEEDGLPEAGRTEPKVEEREPIVICHMEEEEEHLSPVSVMDFRSEDEETTTATSTSPCFHQCLTKAERAHLQLAQQIRRFDSLDELEPVGLQDRFTALDGAHQQSNDSLGGSFEKLLVDFFVEGLLSRRCSGGPRESGEREEARLLAAARDWVDGAVDNWERQESRRGEMEMGEMESSGRWGCFDEEVGEVGEGLEGLVANSILGELVRDIIIHL